MFQSKPLAAPLNQTQLASLQAIIDYLEREIDDYIKQGAGGDEVYTHILTLKNYLNNEPAQCLVH